MIVTRRKRVIVVQSKTIDLGDMWLSDWIQPDCYACSKEIIDYALDKYHRLPDADVAVETIGFGNLMVKMAWNVVNTYVRYRYDTDLFSQADFWLTPNETWTLRFGDCEDTSFLLTSTILRLFEVIRDLQASWWSRLLGKAPVAYTCIGFYRLSANYYGHGFVLYRNPKYKITDKWFILETTLEKDVAWNMWIPWEPSIYIPVYIFNNLECYRIDRDYRKFGLTYEYTRKYLSLIKSMINYVESGIHTKQKWMHKTIRPAKPKYIDLRLHH